MSGNLPPFCRFLETLEIDCCIPKLIVFYYRVNIDVHILKISFNILEPLKTWFRPETRDSKICLIRVRHLQVTIEYAPTFSHRVCNALYLTMKLHSNHQLLLYCPSTCSDPRIFWRYFVPSFLLRAVLAMPKHSATQRTLGLVTVL